MPAGIRDNKFGAFNRALKGEMRRRLARAAAVVARRAKDLLGVAGTFKRDSGGKVLRDRRGRFLRVYGAFPSRPGEPPHKQTGRLRGSVAWELVDTGRTWIARVGTNVRYGRFLELGTRRIRPRPWLVRSLDESRSQIRTILAAPWRWPG